MNFAEIQNANATIRTTNIKGKDYAEVNQRIKAFRMVYPTGYIRTEILFDEEGRCVMSAECGYNTDTGEQITLGTGHAYEKESSSYINKTSYIENCETSAVGRALGMAGFGIDTSVASYEEVANAIHQQDENQRLADEPNKIEPDKYIAMCKDCGHPIKPHKGPDGKITTVDDIVVRSLNAFGRPLCVECGRKAAESK